MGPSRVFVCVDAKQGSPLLCTHVSRGADSEAAPETPIIPLKEGNEMCLFS